MKQRIFYAAGAGNVIEAHKYWKKGEPNPTEVSITFISQFEEFCKDIGAEAYIVSYHSNAGVYNDGPFTLEHRPKRTLGSRGIGYHVAEILYGFSLLVTAVRFKATIAVLDSGSSHYFVFGLFRLVGIKTINVLHNTLWPSGFPPTRLVPRLIATLDSLYFRWAPAAIIVVSPECVRQVRDLTRERHKLIYQIRAQFRREYFQTIHPPPPHNKIPFRIMYSGRIHRTKGIFDVLEIARKIEFEAPGRVRWEICGSGPDLDELSRKQAEMSLVDVVTVRGWTSPSDLRDVLGRSHALIVPTRSSFNEGLAMVAAEAVLAGRPVITNPVVPAFEILRPACIEARTDDVDSYTAAILNLIDNPSSYKTLCAACPALSEQFYDRQRGLTAVLKTVIA